MVTWAISVADRFIDSVLSSPIAPTTSSAGISGSAEPVRSGGSIEKAKVGHRDTAIIDSKGSDSLATGHCAASVGSDEAWAVWGYLEGQAVDEILHFFTERPRRAHSSAVVGRS